MKTYTIDQIREAMITAEQIEDRIRSEKRKYNNTNIDWIKLAAKKIHGSIKTFK